MNVLSNIFKTILLLTIDLCIDPLPNGKLPHTNFDFIVVGAGSAGSVVANRLSENPGVNVLLLEAGGCPPPLLSTIPAISILMYFSKYNWGLYMTPQNNSFISYKNNQGPFFQGKMLGGTSSINDMMYIRGNRFDYDNWANLGNTGWSYSDVLPFFLKSERNVVPGEMNDKTYHNTSGPLVISNPSWSSSSLVSYFESAKLNGYLPTDVNGANQTGVSLNPMTMNNGERCSTYIAYLKPAKNRPNLVILTHAHVTKILFNAQKRATGVQYEVNNQIYTVTASKEVIVSAGALNSPKLLLLSGVGPAAQLQSLKIPVVKDLQGVGKNLHDHVGTGALIWKVNCFGCTYSLIQAVFPGLLQWILFRTGPDTLILANEATAFVKTKYVTQNEDYPDVQLIYATVNFAAIAMLFFGLSPAASFSFFGPLIADNTYVIVPIYLTVKSRGQLTLQSSDPHKPPLIDFNYFSDPRDMKTLVDGMRLGIAFGNSTVMRGIGAQINPTVYPGCGAHTLYSDDYLECIARHYTLVFFHAVGTCKMGTSSDPMAVVDSQLSVYGVTNLSVIDASIMPVVTRGNTNAPSIMIGEKGAASVKQKHGV